MDIAVSLGLEAAATSVLALPEKYLKKEAAYSLNDGHLLLSVTLGGKEREKTHPEDISAYLAGEKRCQSGVRLVPSLGSKMKRAIRNAASGFELHTYGKAACGLFSFALTAFILGTGAPAASDLPSCAEMRPQRAAVLSDALASISEPAPNHAFRRGRLSGWNMHQNVTGEHINYDMVHHTNEEIREPGDYTSAGDDLAYPPTCLPTQTPLPHIDPETIVQDPDAP